MGAGALFLCLLADRYVNAKRCDTFLDVSKYGKQQHRESKRQAKNMTAPGAKPEKWAPDSNRETESETERYACGPDGIHQITIRKMYYANTTQLVGFAVTYAERNENGDWSEIICIDTCHWGTAHRHRNGDHSVAPETICPLDSENVLRQALGEALDEVYDLVNWEDS